MSLAARRAAKALSCRHTEGPPWLCPAVVAAEALDRCSSAQSSRHTRRRPAPPLDRQHSAKACCSEDRVTSSRAAAT